MSVKRLYNLREQFFDSNGDPLSGGQLFVYLAGSSTRSTTYNSSTGLSANTNPLVLDSSGRLQAEVWVATGLSYKLVLGLTGDGTAFVDPSSPVWTEDNVTGINDTTGLDQQWILGPTPTYIGATQFSLVGDQTTNFEVGRRVKATVTAGTVYGTIKSSVFGAATTVTLTDQSGSLDSGLSAVYYSILGKSNDALPRGVFPTLANVSKFIYGMTYANAAGDVTNDLDIASGGCVDSTGAYFITTSALTKQSDAVWAVGNAAGGLDMIGSAGNNDFYIWAIARPDTGVTDYLYSLSSTAPTMPANYTYKRLMGFFKRVGGSIVLFHTYETEGGGIETSWDVPTLDVNLSNTLTTSRRTDAVKVPLNFSVIALLYAQIFDASSAFVAVICCPDQADAAVVSGTATGGNFETGAAAVRTTRPVRVRTSAAGLIAARASLATVDTYLVVTEGFVWSRR